MLEQKSGISLIIVDRVREGLARFALNNPNIFNAISQWLTGEDDPLMPNRLTSRRQQQQISDQYRKKLAGDEYSDEAVDRYRSEHPGKALSIKLLVDAISEVIGQKE